MTYLQRRIERLIELLNAGQLHFAETVDQSYLSQLKEDLTKIRRLESGEIDLETCTPRLRSFARMTYNVQKVIEPTQEQKSAPVAYTVENVVSYQQEYFALLDDVFKGMFGKSAQDFAAPDQFVETAKRTFPAMRESLRENYEAGMTRLHEFYGRHMLSAFAMSKCLQGMRLVFGGGSRFNSTHLGALKQTLLYGDTFLIPDPVLPWFEENRSEERFRHIHVLTQIHALLHLKPIVDAPLPYPAIVVFPSFERLLMRNDPDTADGMGRLTLDFFGHYLDKGFEDESEVVRYSVDHESEFLAQVEKRGLFWAPDAGHDAPLREMIQLYREEIHRWRSAEHCKLADSMPDGLLVFQGILERLQPQFHLRENCDELSAAPIMCLPPHMHYFKLCSDIYNDALADNGVVGAEHLSALRALGHQQFNWLANIPLEKIAKLRADGVNEDFRGRIAQYLGQLHQAKLDDLDSVAYEVGRGIESLLREHEKAARSLERKYKRTFGILAATSLIGPAALLYPSLAPYIGAMAPLGLGVAYLKEKIIQHRESQDLSRSLAGVLAAARDC